MNVPSQIGLNPGEVPMISTRQMYRQYWPEIDISTAVHRWNPFALKQVVPKVTREQVRRYLDVWGPWHATVSPKEDPPVPAATRQSAWQRLMNRDPRKS